MLGRLQEQRTQDGTYNRPQTTQECHQRNSHIEGGIKGRGRIDRLDEVGPDGPRHAHNQRGDDKRRQFGWSGLDAKTQRTVLVVAYGQQAQTIFGVTHPPRDDDGYHHYDQGRVVERDVEEITAPIGWDR